MSAVNSAQSLAASLLCIGGSDYGKDVTVAAPGVAIFSDIPGGGFDDGTASIGGIVVDTCKASGTSFAAPFVAGVAGLMLSANPNITAAEIKNIIMTTADDTGKTDPSGNPIKILNAFRAVQQALAPPNPRIVQLTHYTSGGVAYVQPISANGSKIIFSGAGDPTGHNTPTNSGVFTMNSDGTNLKEVPGAYVIGSLSPDGTKIVFQATPDMNWPPLGSNYDVYVANSDGTNVVQVTQGGGISLVGSISATGSIPFFSLLNFAGLNPEGQMTLFVTNSLGTEFKKISSIPGGEVSHPVISSDGSKVAFAYRDQVLHLFSANVDGSNLRELLQFPPQPFTTILSISADGAWVAFWQTAGGLHVISGDGALLKTTVVGSQFAEAGPISADGTKIVYGLINNFSEYIVLSNTDGSGLIRITDPSSTFSSLAASQPSMSTDAKHILFASGQDLTGDNPTHIWQLFMVNLP